MDVLVFSGLNPDFYAKGVSDVDIFTSACWFQM
jgi:hypothetical protein